MSPSSESFRDILGAIHADGRSGALVALGLGWFFVLGLRFTVPALLPFITRDFPVSNAAAGGAITVLWITYAAVQFPSGALIDRVGERRLLLSSAVLSAAALTAYLGSVTFTVFLLASAAFGIGTGIFGPARGTAVIRTFPDYEGFAYGTVLAGGSLGAALLPALAAVLASTIGWRAAIGVTIPGFLLVGVLVWRTIPQGTAADAVTDGGTAIWSTAGRVYDGVTNRGVLLGILGTTLMLFGFQGLTAFLTTYLVDAKGLTESTAGILFGLLFIVSAVAQSLGGGLSDRYGHRTVLAAFTFVSVVPLVVLPLTSGVLPLAVVAAAMGLRQAAIPVLNSYIVSLLPVDVRGAAWGLLRFDPRGGDGGRRSLRGGVFLPGRPDGGGGAALPRLAGPSGRSPRLVVGIAVTARHAGSSGEGQARARRESAGRHGEPRQCPANPGVCSDCGPRARDENLVSGLARTERSCRPWLIAGYGNG